MYAHAVLQSSQPSRQTSRRHRLQVVHSARSGPIFCPHPQPQPHDSVPQQVSSRCSTECTDQGNARLQEGPGVVMHSPCTPKTLGAEHPLPPSSHPRRLESPSATLELSGVGPRAPLFALRVFRSSPHCVAHLTCKRPKVRPHARNNIPGGAATRSLLVPTSPVQPRPAQPCCQALAPWPSSRGI